MLEEIPDLTIDDDISNDFDYYFNNFFKEYAEKEKDLMLSVLLYGVIDYLSNVKKLKDDAKKWFFDSDDEEWPYSFQNICYNLNIDTKDFKINLIKLSQDPNLDKKLRKLKHLNPATGNRNKISVKSIYQPKEKDDF